MQPPSKTPSYPPAFQPSVSGPAPARPRRRASTGRGRLLISAIGLAVVTVAIGGVWWRNATEKRKRIAEAGCKLHLGLIDQAAVMYAIGQQGRYPATVAELVEAGVSPELLVCPESGDTPAAAGATPQATAANITAGGHCSYVIVAGITNDSPSNAIFAYEPLSNHHGRGIHVVYAGGNHDWVEGPRAERLLAELAAGHNPPRK